VFGKHVSWEIADTKGDYIYIAYKEEEVTVLNTASKRGALQQQKMYFFAFWHIILT